MRYTFLYKDTAFFVFIHIFCVVFLLKRLTETVFVLLF